MRASMYRQDAAMRSRARPWTPRLDTRPASSRFPASPDAVMFAELIISRPEYHVIRHSDESQQRARRAAILEPGVLRPSICTRCPGNRGAGAADAARGDDADGVLDSGDYQAGVEHAVQD